MNDKIKEKVQKIGLENDVYFYTEVVDYIEKLENGIKVLTKKLERVSVIDKDEKNDFKDNN